MKWLTLFAVSFLMGCGSGSTSSGPTQPTPSPTIASVTVAPQTVTVVAGSTKQFEATVTGTNAFNSAVTWSVVGLGTVDQTGLFTASGTPGPATVTATSVETPSMQGSGQVTVTAAPVALLGWYGTLVPSDGSTPLPLDFDLVQTGNNLTNAYAVVIAQTVADISLCTSFELGTAEGYGSVLQSVQNNQNANMFQLSGSVNGQSVSLTLSATHTWPNTPPSPVSLTGKLGQDAAGSATMTGTFSKPAGPIAGANGCFSTPTSGTFSFTQYQSLSGIYAGAVTYGTVGQGTPPVAANNVQLSLTSSAPCSQSVYPTAGICAATLSYAAISPPFNYPASPVYAMQSETAGRFLHVWTDYVGSEGGSTNLVVWGVVAGPDQQGNKLNIYIDTGNIGLAQLFNPATPLSGTMTLQ